MKELYIFKKVLGAIQTNQRHLLDDKFSQSLPPTG